MRCNQCEQELPDDAQYCLKCGSSQDRLSVNADVETADGQSDRDTLQPVAPVSPIQSIDPTFSSDESRQATHTAGAIATSSHTTQVMTPPLAQPSQNSTYTWGGVNPPVRPALPTKEHLYRNYNYEEKRIVQVKPPIFGWLAVVGAAVAVIGSFGPWAVLTAPFFGTVSVSGMKGDGQITIVLSLISAILLLYRLKGGGKGWTVLLPFILLAITSIIGIADSQNISSVMESDGEEALALVQTGWGLNAVLFGSGWGSTILIVHWFRREFDWR